MEYRGAPDADRVVVVMGSGTGAVEETVETMVAAGEKVGVIVVRLFQPFPVAQLMAALPKTVRQIAVLDRTKEPGAVGEPFYQAVVTALVEAQDSDEPPFAVAPKVVGGRYGLSSKEFTPSMVKPVFDELLAAKPKRHFTVGIYDDVTNLSLPISQTFSHPRPAGEVQALFFGLGSDGTVGANKASVKIIGEGTDLFAQGYFVYDSQEVRLGHLVPPALRAQADPLHVPRGGRGLRGLPPVRPAGERPGAGPRQARRHLPAQQPVRSGRGLGPAPGARPAADRGQADRASG